MTNHNHRFIYSIVVPTIATIAMFIVVFFFIIIPMFERSIMDRKQETIIELTNAAWSVLAEYEQAYQNNEHSLEDAQQKAAKHIGNMRYGTEQKDYFWVISEELTMIMHPYRPDLLGTNLAGFTDDHENKLFENAAELVSREGEGVIRYYWQWKDDSTRIVPKLSYVKGFPDWGWIVGTGIYLDDVQAEIKQLKERLLVISLLIVSFIALILFYVLRETKSIESKRQQAEERLRQSIEKYKSLVEASSEGTLMVVNKKVVFANSKFNDLLQIEESADVVGEDISNLFNEDWDELVADITDPKQTSSFELRLRNAKPGRSNVVASVSLVGEAAQGGYIILVKNVTEQKRLRLDAERLSDDVQLSLQMMNQPVSNLVKTNAYCSLSTRVTEAAEIMTRYKSKFVCVKEGEEVIGVVTDTDLRVRVLAEPEFQDKPVSLIMTSPIKTINKSALLFEAVLKFKKENISHLLVENEVGQIIGHIGNQQCLEMQRNSLNYLMKEIAGCSTVEALRRIYNKVPLLIQAVFTSTDNINSVSRIISSIADAITVRVIELAQEQVGAPPCKFAFIAMGSEARGEQTLKTDQDNAIIFENGEHEVKQYFLRMAQIVNENLHAVGYSRCNGDLMAGNPEWCNSLAYWKVQFQHWIESPSQQTTLDSTIFFDTRTVYGEKALLDDLQQHVQVTLDQNPAYFRHLSQAAMAARPIFEKPRVDVKRYLVPIVGYLRLLALRYRIPETNSLLRLQQLLGYGILSEEEGHEIEEMYKFLMHLRIKWQVTLILDNDQPQNAISNHNLTEIEKLTLENITQQISKMLDKLKAGGVLNLNN